MRPTLGRVVLYTRGDGEEFAARITRVVMKPVSGTHETDGGHDENQYEVYLAVDIHTDTRGETWFTPAPIRFDPDGACNTWRWPPMVRS